MNPMNTPTELEYHVPETTMRNLIRLMEEAANPMIVFSEDYQGMMQDAYGLRGENIEEALKILHGITDPQ